MKNFSQKIIFVIILLSTSCGVTITTPSINDFKNDKINFTQSQLSDSLTTKLTAIAARSEILGFSVAILNKDKVLYQKGFGNASKELGTPFTTKTVMPIASISKTLVGVSLMKAVELGKLKLDDDVNQYLPFKLVNPYHPNKVITIKHLATHTSGLKYTKHYDKSYIAEAEFPSSLYDDLKGKQRKEVKRECDLFNSNKEMSMVDFLKNIYYKDGEWYSKKNFLKEGAEVKHSYCNENAAFAALVLEAATGVGYKDFVAQYILTPLEMNNSGWSLSEFEPHERGQLYLNSKPIPIYDTITYPDGNFVTSMDDFVKYFRSLIAGYKGDNNILSAESYQELMKAHHSEPPNAQGIFIEMPKGETGHTGGDTGLITFAMFDKESGYGYVMFFKYGISWAYFDTIAAVRKYAAYYSMTKGL